MQFESINTSGGRLRKSGVCGASRRAWERRQGQAFSRQERRKFVSPSSQKSDALDRGRRVGAERGGQGQRGGRGQREEGRGREEGGGGGCLARRWWSRSRPSDLTAPPAHHHSGHHLPGAVHARPSTSRKEPCGQARGTGQARYASGGGGHRNSRRAEIQERTRNGDGG